MPHKCFELSREIAKKATQLYVNFHVKEHLARQTVSIGNWHRRFSLQRCRADTAWSGSRPGQDGPDFRLLALCCLSQPSRAGN